MSKWLRSLRVRRVSSAAISSAAPSASSTRGVTSPRLPMGVAQTYSMPSPLQEEFDEDDVDVAPVQARVPTRGAHDREAKTEMVRE